MQFVSKTIDGQPAADWKSIQKAASMHKRAMITVESFSQDREISLQQMKWLHGAAIPYLAEKWGHSHLWTENWLKVTCGTDLFDVEEIKVHGEAYRVVSSKKKLSVKQTRVWVENILESCEQFGLEPPDPEWRKKVSTPLFG